MLSRSHTFSARLPEGKTENAQFDFEYRINTGNFDDESSCVPWIGPVHHVLLVLLNVSPFNSVFLTPFLSSDPLKQEKGKFPSQGEQPHLPVSCCIPPNLAHVQLQAKSSRDFGGSMVGDGGCSDFRSPKPVIGISSVRRSGG